MVRDTDVSRTKKPKFTIENKILVGEQVPFPDGPLNSGQVILDIFNSRPDFIGQIESDTGKRTTFAEMREKIIRCAIWLRKQGVKRGDVIGQCLDHPDEYVPFIATLCIGAVCYPGDYDLRPFCTRTFISDGKPKVVFLHANCLNTLENSVKECGVKTKVVIMEDIPGIHETFDDILSAQTSAEVAEFRCAEVENPKEVCGIYCTSGTSGLPKGALITHMAMRTYLLINDNSDLMNRLCWSTSDYRWMYGPVCTLRTIAAFGTRLFSPYQDDPDEFCQILSKNNVEWVGGCSYLGTQLVKYGIIKKYHLPCLKVMEFVGSAFPKDAHEEISRLLPHVFIKQYYGLTDVGGICAQVEGCRPGTCGYLFRNTRLKIIDVSTGQILGPNKTGEVCVKSPGTLVGYLNDTELYEKTVDKDGWMHTGDVGYYDVNGEICVIGRISEFIMRKSSKVSPAEIEAVLESHPAVVKAVAVPIPDDIEGDVPFAFVVKFPNEEVTEGELICLVQKNLTPYHYLEKGLKFIDEIPRTRSGKVARAKLKEMAKSL